MPATLSAVAVSEAARKVALLNQQVAALRSQLGALQDLLDASSAKDADARVQIEALGSQLNSALARVADEQKRRAAPRRHRQGRHLFGDL